MTQDERTELDLICRSLRQAAADLADAHRGLAAARARLETRAGKPDPAPGELEGIAVSLEVWECRAGRQVRRLEAIAREPGRRIRPARLDRTIQQGDPSP